MDQKTAASLLEEIQQEKQANPTSFSGPTSWFSRIGNPSSPNNSLVQDVKRHANSQMQHGAINTILKAMLLAGGTGAAMRGITGLQNLFSKDEEPVPSRTVDMPVAYPSEEKEAGMNEGATAPYGLNYFIPGMLLGTPLAAYAGWKGVDAMLDKQRQQKTEDELDRVKKDYQQALLDSYKTAEDGEEVTEDLLDSVFDQTKSAGVTDFIQKFAPNLPGAATGLMAAYAIPATIGGYAVVDSVMKKRSKRALLRKAMAERARRQARQQPAELYAIPVPKEEQEPEIGN